MVLRVTSSGRGMIAPVVSCAELPGETPAGQPAVFDVRAGGGASASRSNSAAGCGLIGVAPAFAFPGFYLLHRHRRRGAGRVR
ncbi:MAG TPA: hypothetical protein P5316_05390, partial [Phycisphaerae bacterium]|nr:hypothetical protein [Phycisphaerae bacterium]